MLLWLAAGYSAGWFTSARWLFRRWRSIQGPLTCERDHESSRYGGYNHYNRCCVDDARQSTTSYEAATAGAMFASLAWPVVLITVLVRCEPLKALRKLRARRQIRQPSTTITLRDPAWEKDMEDQLGIPRD
jgi:hypothetical protein